jgi:hypothetical protein
VEPVPQLAAHWPLVQRVPSAQTTPQPPQLPLSLLVTTQALPPSLIEQATSPKLVQTKAQAELVHAWAGPQVMPQPPQLALSSVKLAQ